MRRRDDVHLEHAVFGNQRLTVLLRREGWEAMQGPPERPRHPRFLQPPLASDSDRPAF